MTLKEQIEYLEAGAEDDLKAMSPKDRMTYYGQIKEYEVPKFSRIGFVAASELPQKIELVLVK